MAGSSNFPGGLDDNASLYDVTDGSSSVVAAHHNNLKEAIKAIEAKLGIRSSSVATSLDYRLGNPTGGHNHDGASGNGPLLTVDTPTQAKERWVPFSFSGTIATGATAFPAVIVPKTAQVTALVAGLRVGPSGGTTVLDIHAGATSLWQATQANRPMIGPTTGAIFFSIGTPDLGTVPSGVALQIAVDGAGANSGGQDLSITFVFRE